MTEHTETDNFWSQLVIASSRLTRHALVRQGRTPGSVTFRVLGMLWAHPEGLRIGEIARMENSTQATASNLVSRLRRDGIVETSIDPQDGRASLVSLTRRGRNLVKEITTGFEEVLSEDAADLSEEEMEKLRQAVPIMAKIVAGSME